MGPDHSFRQISRSAIFHVPLASLFALRSLNIANYQTKFHTYRAVALPSLHPKYGNSSTPCSSGINLNFSVGSHDDNEATSLRLRLRVLRPDNKPPPSRHPSRMANRLVREQCTAPTASRYI